MLPLTVDHWELFLSKVNNRVTIAVIEVNIDTHCLQKRIESSRCKGVGFC